MLKKDWIELHLSKKGKCQLQRKLLPKFEELILKKFCHSRDRFQLLNIQGAVVVLFMDQWTEFDSAKLADNVRSISRAGIESFELIER
jgi:hypothetical protein